MHRVSEVSAVDWRPEGDLNEVHRCMRVEFFKAFNDLNLPDLMQGKMPHERLSFDRAFYQKTRRQRLVFNTGLE